METAGVHDQTTNPDESRGTALAATRSPSKICTLWVHDEQYSKEDVLVNGDFLSDLRLAEGTLLSISAIGKKLTPANAHTGDEEPLIDDQHHAARSTGTAQETVPAISRSRNQQESKLDASLPDDGHAEDKYGHSMGAQKQYLCYFRPMNPETKARNPNVQVSVCSHIASVFNFTNRMKVLVSVADEQAQTASFVEIAFRDEYLARADMWRLTVSELWGKTMYKGQTLVFLGTIRATIKNIYISGRKVFSACFSSITKPVFRSESARYILFIQMSKEMWDFDESSGDIMFNKVIDGFLPELFKRWVEMNVRHLVSIILFTRFEYGPALDRPIGEPSHGGPPEARRDFYRVVVSEMASGEWTTILHQLKMEFKFFLRDVQVMQKPMTENRTSEQTASKEAVPPNPVSGKSPSEKFARENLAHQHVAHDKPVAKKFAGERVDRGNVAPGSSFAKEIISEDNTPQEAKSEESNPKTGPEGSPSYERSHDDNDGFYEIRGRPSNAMHGNVLEAINLACSQFSTDFIDRDLVRTGIAVAVITAGTGVYEVDWDLLKLTSDNLVENGIGIDLVCLSPMPLHSVPLLKYRDPGVSISKPTLHGEALGDPTGYTSGSEELRRRLATGPLDPDTGNVSMLDRRSTSGGGKNVDNWSYAIPHWMDVSYWDELSEAGTSNARLDVVKSKTPISHARHRRDFSLRCRMYQLQALGMPENDMNTVEIPLLYHGPFEPVSTPNCSSAQRDSISYIASSWPIKRGMGNLSPHSSSPNTSHYRKTPEAQGLPSKSGRRASWMDEYDKGPFQPSPQFDAQENIEATEVSPAFPDDRAATAHVSGNGVPPMDETAFLETRSAVIGEALIPLGNSQQAQDGIEGTVSRVSNMQVMPQIPRKTLRHINIGMRGIGPAKASASIGFSLETANITTSRSDMAISAPRKNAYAVSHQVQSSIRLSASCLRAPSLALPKGHGERNAEASQPIPIRREVFTRSSMAKVGDLDASTGVVWKDSNDSDILQADSQVQQTPENRPSHNSANQQYPKPLSDTYAISPWFTVLNPSNPQKYNAHFAAKLGRWQHVFPRSSRVSRIKWKALCSPAAVPLTTEQFPTLEQMAVDYDQDRYDVVQNEREELHEDPKQQEPLIRELVAMRLSHGFQLVTDLATGQIEHNVRRNTATVFNPSYMASHGTKIYMIARKTIHQLSSIGLGQVAVVIYTLKSKGADVSRNYQAQVRTLLAHDYEDLQVVLRTSSNECNWNYMDHFLAGYQEQFSDLLRFWCARFVLIPVEISSNRRPLSLLNEDSEEEIRIEGIRKFTQLIQQRRYMPPQERQKYQQHFRTRKDPNPLAIEYQTTDPSAVVAAGFERSDLIDGDASGYSTQLSADNNELYHSSNIDVQKLAQDIQGDKGVQLIDRRWHLKLHYNCFLGEDFTSWLLQRFEDIETRDEAVELGNKLMRDGLFIHVQRKHRFRDGNYFYQIASDYRIPRPDSRTGWFGTKRSDRSVPSTPVSEPMRTSSLPERPRSRSNTASTSHDSAEKTPSKPNTSQQAQRKVALSHVIRYDVDPRRRSYRPEILNLHYDRLHNPDNCYHVRIEWMNVTAKLIEDAIVSWATLVDRYGLKLVEVPIAEAAKYTDAHPFRAPYCIKLAHPPPLPQTPQYSGTAAVASQARSDKHLFHKALLKKLGFVLDFESAASFPANVDVTYSWGKPDYRYTQFIHKSGVLLAQITDEGNFLLQANRLCRNRAATVKDIGKLKEGNQQDRRGAVNVQGKHGPISSLSQPSPMSSPLVYAVAEPTFSASGYGGHDKIDTATKSAEQIKDDVESFCHDERALKHFYDEVLQLSAQATPQSTPHSTPLLDASIPTLSLPPRIAGRAISPAPLAHAAEEDSAETRGDSRKPIVANDKDKR